MRLLETRVFLLARALLVLGLPLATSCNRDGATQPSRPTPTQPSKPTLDSLLGKNLTLRVRNIADGENRTVELTASGYMEVKGSRGTSLLWGAQHYFRSSTPNAVCIAAEGKGGVTAITGGICQTTRSFTVTCAPERNGPGKPYSFSEGDLYYCEEGWGDNRYYLFVGDAN